MDRVHSREEIDGIADPKARLAMAGARALMDHAFEILSAGVSPDLVTSVAGRTRRVFYDHFEDKETFLREVFADVYDAGLHHLVTQATPEEVSALLQLTQGDLFDAVERLAALAFSGVLDSEADRMQILGWAMAQDDPEIGRMLADYYHGVDAASIHVIVELMDAWGLEFRPPWTAERLACVLHAIGEGLYMRAAVDPELADLDLFELTCLSLMPIAAAPAGQTGDDVRRYLDAFAMEVAESWRRHAADPYEEASYERLAAGFRDELRASGFSAATITSVARRCRISPALIERNFPTATSLLRSVVDDSLPSLQSEADFDLADGDITIREALGRHLRRIGTWVTGNPELGTAILACGGSNPHDAERGLLTLEVVRELSAPAVSILVAGIARGEIREDAMIVELASMTTEIVLGRGSAMPDFSIEPTVEFVQEVVFDGAGVPVTRPPAPH
ncbi:MAG: TetR/AcrR family transcriptional regulator [Actinomycetota bacterium]